MNSSSDEISNALHELCNGDRIAKDAVSKARLLRNSCAGDIENATGILRSGFTEWLRSFFQRVALSRSDEDEFEDEEALQQYVTALCQFLSNFGACCSETASSLWDATIFGETGFRNAHAAASRVRSRKALAAVVSAMYNSFMQLERSCGVDSSQVKEALASLCTSRGLLSQILLSIPTGAGVLSAQCLSSADEDPFQEWVHLLCCYLFKRGVLTTAFQSLQPRAQGESVWGVLAQMESADRKDDRTSALSSSVETTSLAEGSAFTHEQVILLHIVLDIFRDPAVVKELTPLLSARDKANKTKECDKDSAELQEEAPASGASIESEVVYWSVKDTTRALATLADRTVTRIHFPSNDSLQNDSEPSAATSSSPSASAAASTSPGANSDDSIRVLTLCLETLGAALAWLTDKSGNEVRTLLDTETHIVDVCRRILQVSADEKRCRVTRRKKASDAVQAQSVSTEDGKLLPSSTNADTPTSASSMIGEEFAVKYGDLIKAALCVVGNLSIRCPVVQDDIRISGVLSLVLSHCTTDFANPLEREWALMCVRNACEGCLANQEFISSLQPQGVIQDETLRERGISVNFDASTGKFTVDQDKDKK